MCVCVCVCVSVCGCLDSYSKALCDVGSEVGPSLPRAPTALEPMLTPASVNKAVISLCLQKIASTTTTTTTTTKNKGVIKRFHHLGLETLDG